jgi:phosphoribosylformylglycinamidine synthase
MKRSDNFRKEEVSMFLTADEIFSIEKAIGRKPNTFELNMYAAMWSEHISYKSSTKWIEELPATGEGVIIGAGIENAGVIDLGGEMALVIKMESHNHPIAKNPGEAAVGVGNIFRDVIAMGARPVAHLNILRFGNPVEEETRMLVKRVIQGLGSYSNAFGVPVVGGEILFHSSYSFNPLLNLMTLGLVKKDRLITASFKETGHHIFLIGQETSGSGVHGAGFASTPFTRETDRLVPESQLADPHAGKILFDCIMELTKQHAISAMQDIGAGGVLCAAAEMASRGETGVELRLDQFPRSRMNMEPIDILLSQSQEQMLVAIDPERMDLFRTITEKWEVPFARVGEVRQGHHIKVFFENELMGDLPVSSLVRGGGAPMYIRNILAPERKVVKVSADEVPFPGSLKEVARQMISLPNIASRRWIYEQFDTSAGLTNVSMDFASDAGILRMLGDRKIIAVSVDGNSRYIKMEPRKGTMIAVLEAARNIVCSGGTPGALVNGLNFGDPSDSAVYYDFAECVRGIRQACEKTGIPVLGGNVSFNNQMNQNDETVAVQPTPVIGMVGLIEDESYITAISFQSKGDMIYLIGQSDNDLSGSEYLATFHLVEDSAAPEFDIEKELKTQEVISKLIRNRLIVAAHDVSLGGLFVALVECALTNTLGFDITSPAEVRADAFLFNESQSRVIVSVNPEKETPFIDFMMESGLPFSALGHVTKEELRIDDKSFGFIDDYAREFEHALGNLFEKKSADE